MEECIFHMSDSYPSLIDDLISGIKTVEGRKATESKNKITIGSYVTLVCGGRKEKFKVIDIRKYKSINDYLTSEGYRNCIPFSDSFMDAYDIYMDFNKEECEFLAFKLHHVP